MMKALRSMQVLPGPGQVLRLGTGAAFRFDQDCNSLFVRNCYLGLFSALASMPTPRLYVGRWPELVLAHRIMQSPSNFFVSDASDA